jgi:UDP-N-acetylmuramoylalanine-D-glutamate ligase
MARILVCGGRDYFNYAKVCEVMNNLWSKQTTPMVVIEGGARGADTLARLWAKTNNHVEVNTYPADWKSYGRAAGAIRNKQMLDEGKPDLVVAFPGGSGTADMVKRAKKAGIEVVEIDG